MPADPTASRFQEAGREGRERSEQHHALTIDNPRIDMRDRHRRRAHFGPAIHFRQMMVHHLRVFAHRN